MRMNLKEEKHKPEALLQRPGLSVEELSEVDNLMGLTALWNRYEDGTLKEHLFDFFVTDEMKTRAGGEENVELTVTIEREEYEKAYSELVQEADDNERGIPERGVRRHSDSVLSVPPRTDEKLLITLAQVKHQVVSLEERMDVLDPQMVALENGDSGRPQVRNRRLSDSFLLLKPSQDEVSLRKLTQLENKIKLLEERVEILEIRRPIDLSSEGLDQNASYEWLGKTKMYVDNLPFETQSLITEITDSGLEMELNIYLR
ncbi:uncharacterized protein LOC111347564 [Stylophora pistillata]|uniref:uncharacterized protein LOC111347564 n=1 Tax=Stylophora pistillata TaxID=50429 RepID=UPI000C0452E5|nr:uncharacterized protein LOC111347564 [Stylophora pistillata]